MGTTTEKSLPLAIGLNFVMPGLGYMYMGKWIVGIFACLLIIGIYLTTALMTGIFSAWVTVELIMLIDMLILGNKNKKKVLAETTKKCPSCAELIQREAKVCRFCGTKLETIGDDIPVSSESLAATPAVETPTSEPPEPPATARDSSPPLAQPDTPESPPNRTFVAIVSVLALLAALGLIVKGINYYQTRDIPDATQTGQPAASGTTPTPAISTATKPAANTPQATNLENVKELKTALGTLAIVESETGALSRKLVINDQQVRYANQPIQADIMEFVGRFDLPDGELVVTREMKFCAGSGCADAEYYRAIHLLTEKRVMTTGLFGDGTAPRISSDGLGIIFNFGDSGIATFQNGGMRLSRKLMLPPPTPDTPPATDKPPN